MKPGLQENNASGSARDSERDGAMNLQFVAGLAEAEQSKMERIKMSKNIKWALGIVAALIVVAAIVVYPRLVVTLPDDGADAKPFTFKDTRGHRYTEMFLIGGNAITKDLKANVYNTWGLNGGDTTGDSCPAALLDKVDVNELKDQYHVLASFKNGPRLWTLDWIEVEMGKELDFGGMKARWVNWLDLKGLSLEAGWRPTTRTSRSGATPSSASTRASRYSSWMTRRATRGL